MSANCVGFVHVRFLFMCVQSVEFAKLENSLPFTVFYDPEKWNRFVREKCYVIMLVCVLYRNIGCLRLNKTSSMKPVI